MEKMEGCVGIYRGLKTNFGLGFRILEKDSRFGLRIWGFQKTLWGVKGFGFGVWV